MAADPNAVQRQPLNIGYQYTPSMYHPGNVNVPTQAGELWAGVGKSALTGAQEVFSSLMNSPLNPVVKAQMAQAKDLAERGKEVIDQNRATRGGWKQVGVTPQGAGITPLITAPYTTVTANPDVDTTNNPPGTSNTGPQVRRTGVNTGIDDKTGIQYQEATPGSGQWQPIVGPAAPLKSPTQEAQQPGMYRGGLVRQPPPAPGYQEGGVVWDPNQAGKTAPTVSGQLFPMQAPPAPVSQAAPQPPIPMAPPPSPHPVMSSGTALDWAKNFDTSTKRAVYLPQVNPGGEPGFQFYGGRNQPLGPPVTVSTIAKHGGAGQVVGENLDTTLNVASAGQPGQPPSQQPYPTIASDQGGPQGAPPPAPGQGPLLTSTGYNPAPYQQAAPTAAQTAANPQNVLASNQPAGSAQPTTVQADASEPPQPKTYDISPDERARLTSDADSNHTWITDAPGSTPYLNLPAPEGGYYTRRFYRGSTGFQDGFWSTDNWQKQQLLDAYGGAKGPPTDKVLTKDDVDKLSPQDITDKLNRARWWANTTPMTPDDPYYQSLFARQEASKNIQRVLDIDAATQKAGKPTTAYGTTEEGYSQEVAKRNALLGIRTDVPTLQPPNVPITSVSGPGGVQIPTDLGRLWNVGWGGYHGAMAGGHQYTNPVADDMASATKNLMGWLGVLHSTAYPSLTQPGPPAALNIHGAGAVDGGSAGASQRIELPGSDPTGMLEINRLLQGGDHDAAIAALKQRKTDIDKSLQTDLINAPLALKRVPDNMRDNNRALLNNQPLPDDGNGYRDAHGNVRIPGAYKHPFGEDTNAAVPGPSPSPSPTSATQSAPTPVKKEVADAAPRPKTQADFDAIPKGALFWDQDGKLKPKP